MMGQPQFYNIPPASSSLSSLKTRVLSGYTTSWIPEDSALALAGSEPPSVKVRHFSMA